MLDDRIRIGEETDAAMGGKGLSQADTYLLAFTIPRCLLTID